MDLSKAISVSETNPAIGELETLLSMGFAFPELKMENKTDPMVSDEGPFGGTFVEVAVIAIVFNFFVTWGLVYAPTDALAKVRDAVGKFPKKRKLHPLFKLIGLHPLNTKQIDNSRAHISRFLLWNYSFLVIVSVRLRGPG